MMNLVNIPKMLTIKQAAKETGLAEYFIRQLVNEKKIHFIKSGRKTFINLNKLIEFLNGSLTTDIEEVS